MAGRRVGIGLAGGLVVLVALGVFGLFLSSPRHRHFYSQLMGQEEIRPAAPALPRADADREASRQAPGSRIGSPSTRPQTAVKVVTSPLPRLPSKGLPPGWALKQFDGAAQVEVVQDDAHLAFHLVSERSSFALYRDVILDLKEFPILSWWWKITRLPTDGDIRALKQDDQAAQVYLVFPRWPSPRSQSHVVGYVWDTQAPAGSTLTSLRFSNVRVVVVRSGGEQLGQWVHEQRNAYQDYVNLFGQDPPRVGMVAVMIDSNDTRSRAEAYVDDLLFARAPAPRTASSPPHGR